MPGFYGSTGWGDAICVVPWVLCSTTATAAILEETLPAMVRWVDFVWSISDGPIVQAAARTGAAAASPLATGCSRSGPSEKPLPTIGDDAAATIYLYISSTLTAKVARVARRRGDSASA